MGFISSLFALGVLMMILFIPVMIILVVYLIGLWKLFKKCDYNGWEAIIPFYNSFILIKISGLNSWYYLLLIGDTLVWLLSIDSLTWIGSLSSLVAKIFMYYNISKKFHKDIFFTILIVFFPFIMIPILGFKKDNIYDSHVWVSPNGPIGDKNFDNDNYSNNNGTYIYCRYCGTKLESQAKYCSSCERCINED